MPIDLASLRQAISPERLNGYHRRGSATDELSLYTCYAWNITLCESLYPALHGIEVALRNSIHMVAMTYLGGEDWLMKTPLQPRALKEIDEAKERLSRESYSTRAGDIIATLSFGFWVHLFDRPHERYIKPPFLANIFPYLPRKDQTPNTVRHRFASLLHLRNRVFHHEPIWYWPNLVQRHNEIWGTIEWISPAMLNFVKAIDRFPEVYQNGHDTVRQCCQTLFNS
jgi:hypothetical protein